MNLSANVTRIGRWAMVATALSWLGCAVDSGDANDDHSNDPCVPGQSIACECDDGSPGAQVCEPDGVGFDECTCEGAEDDSGSNASGSGNDTASDDDDGPGDDSADNGSDPTDPTDPTNPTAATAEDDGSDSSSDVPDFQNDIVPILYTSCGASNVLCHARNAYFPTADQGCRGWLSLEDQPLGSYFDDLDPETQMASEGPVPGCEDKTLHERLLLLAPWECGADARYIAPGSPDDSYIFRKLTDGTICGDFRVMPPPEEGFVISDDEVAMLEAWILAGAPE